jgi:hypothetical protein
MMKHNILIFGKPEATMKQWGGWQESHANAAASKTNTMGR